MNTVDIIKSYVRNAVKNGKKNGKSIEENINFAQLCHKANIANDDYENDDCKNNPSRKDTNFMTYALKARKIFNQNNQHYHMSDSQIKKHKNFIKKQLALQIEKSRLKLS